MKGIAFALLVLTVLNMFVGAALIGAPRQPLSYGTWVLNTIFGGLACALYLRFIGWI